VNGDGTVVFMHSGVLNWDDDRTRTFLKSVAAQSTKELKKTGTLPEGILVTVKI